MQTNAVWTVKEITHYPETAPTDPGAYCLIGWAAGLTDGNYEVNTYGTTPVTFYVAPPVDPENPVEPPENPIIWQPMDQLTNQICADWVKASLGENAVDANIAALVAQLYALENPPVAPVVPPWVGETVVKPLNL